MKKLLTLSFSLLVCVSFALKAQQLHQCDENKSYWILSKDEDNFIVELSGKAQESEKKGVITINGYILQGLIINKSAFIDEGEKDSKELQILVRYALSEADYFSKLFKTKINIQIQKAVLSDGKEVLLWFFDMPESITANVKRQLFVNMLIGDKIIGLASPQIADQKFEDVRNFLTNAISILKKIEDKNKLTKECLLLTRNIKSVCLSV